MLAVVSLLVNKQGDFVDAYYVTPVPPFPTALGAAFNTFTSRQDISQVPCPIILPNQLRIGSKIKIEAEGEYGSTGTPTIILGFYVGLPGASGAPAAITTILAESGALATSTATAFPWRLEYRGIITGMGTSGQIVGSGNVELSTLTALTTTAIPITAALRTVTLDTTLSRCVGICATWSASNAANTVKVHNSSVLLLN